MVSEPPPEQLNFLPLQELLPQELSRQLLALAGAATVIIDTAKAPAIEKPIRRVNFISPPIQLDLCPSDTLLDSFSVMPDESSLLRNTFR